MFSEAIKDILRAVSSGLQIPVIIILILLILVTVIMLGSLIAEFFSERAWLKMKIPHLIDAMQGKNAEELADILEVVYALAEANGVARQELMAVYQKKHDARGGFGKRIFLISKD